MQPTFATWLASARPNDTFCYHVGTNLGVPVADKDTVEEVRRAYNEGRIELVQRAIGAAYSQKLRDFEYLAVKRETIARRSSYLDVPTRMPLAA